VWWKAGEGITFRDHKDLAAWSEATGQEKLNGQIAGKEIDPKLNGPFVTTITDPYQLYSLVGYTLSKKSPLYDSASGLTRFKLASPARDFFDNPVSGNSIPGIYQGEK
jgi:hypothetical protein